MPATTSIGRLSEQRSPEACPHREPCEPEAPDSARCGLLKRIGDDRPGLDDRVVRETCEWCCRSFPPSLSRFNPVIASLVYDRASRSLADASAREEIDRLSALRRRAVAYLEIDAPVSRGSPMAHPPAAGRDIRSLLDVVPYPATMCGGPVRHWAVGVTTSPRRRPTLEACLASLKYAGWPRPYLFVDGAVSLPPEARDLTVIYREPAIGAWPNYLLAIHELLLREPLADAYMLVQDDTLFCPDPGLRGYLEGMLWPGDAPGLVSLYCAAPETLPESGWARYPGAWRYSSLAFVFPAAAARDFASSPTALRHRSLPDDRGLVGIPDVIGAWTVERGVPLHFPTPSLVQHLGETSSIWHGAYDLSPARRAASFAGDLLPVDGAARDDPAASATPRRVHWPGPDRSSAVFPEHEFPCHPDFQARYWELVDRGRDRMGRASVVICGIGRDVATYLPATAARIERLARGFERSRIVLFENDSVDDTPNWLAEWAAQNPLVLPMSEPLGQPKLDRGIDRERTIHMAYYRNRCRERILSQFGDHDFVITIDLDLAGGWSFDGVAHSFGHEDWDAIGSYGLAARPRPAAGLRPWFHYDCFAYREPGRWDLPDFARVNALRFERGAPLVRTGSCFGGLALYRMECLRAAAYSGEDCEHVCFHRALHDQGYDRLFLNPSQIVLYSDPAR